MCAIDHEFESFLINSGSGFAIKKLVLELLSSSLKNSVEHKIFLKKLTMIHSLIQIGWVGAVKS